MLVQCPECTTKYNLDDSRIGKDGIKVRCTRCKHVFPVFKPTDELFAEQPLLDPKAVSNGSARAAGARPDADMLADLEGAFQQPLLGAERSNSLDPDAKPLKTKKSGKLGWILVLLVLVLAGSGAGLFVLKPAWLPHSDANNTSTPATAPPADPKAAISQIALENVRQYFVPNEKEGQLFIIEGKAVNHFPDPKELIKLKASLFDAKSTVVTSQEFMCGNVVSLYQLQVSTRQDIENALAAKVGILTNNTNIQPGSSVPFMVVFFKAPETVEEFGLEVVQAQTPPKQ